MDEAWVTDLPERLLVSVTTSELATSRWTVGRCGEDPVLVQSPQMARDEVLATVGPWLVARDRQTARLDYVDQDTNERRTLLDSALGCIRERDGTLVGLGADAILRAHPDPADPRAQAIELVAGVDVSDFAEPDANLFPSCSLAPFEIDGDDVYALVADGSVVRTPLTGGSPTTVLPGPVDDFGVLDPGRLLSWKSEGSLYVRDLPSGTDLQLGSSMGSAGYIAGWIVHHPWAHTEYDHYLVLIDPDTGEGGRVSGDWAIVGWYSDIELMLAERQWYADDDPPVAMAIDVTTLQRRELGAPAPDSEHPLGWPTYRGETQDEYGTQSFRGTLYWRPRGDVPPHVLVASLPYDHEISDAGHVVYADRPSRDESSAPLVLIIGQPAEVPLTEERPQKHAQTGPEVP